MTTQSLCPRCQAPVLPGMRFCAQCGRDISAEQAIVTTLSVPKATMASITELAEQEMLSALRDATLGDYDIKGELGRGGMAIVYLAHDISLDRKVAIKVMLPTMIRGDGMIERFKREARTAASLSHPHIIPIHAVKETDQILCFVMKFVSGRGLDSVIKKIGRLPIPMITTILSQVGSALGYAHRRGVIHRDIKPANIIIDEEGWAVVTDFGIAKISDAANLTASGAAVGTPTYMSPEQCSGKQLLGASDQYSLGIVAYEMLTGRQPFGGDSIMEIMKQHFFDMPQAIDEVRPDCPPALRDIVMRMLAKEPGHRFPSLEDCVTAIGAAPLSQDDPVRTQLVELAQSAAAELQVTRLKTPRSPMPAVRQPPAAPRSPEVQTPTVPPTMEAASMKRGRGWLVAVPLMVIAAGGGAWAALNWDRLSSAFGSGVPATVSDSPTEPQQLAANLPTVDPVAPAGSDTMPGNVQAAIDSSTTRPAVPRQTPAPVEAAPAPRPGTIRLQDFPDDAVIIIDNARRTGRTHQLAPGHHTIRATATGYESYSWAGDLANGADISLPFNAARVAPREPDPAPPPAVAVLQLQTRPATATVTFDGVPLDRSGRIVQHTFSAGVGHLLRISADGFATKDTTITVSPGDTLQLNLTLQRGN